MCRLKNVYQKRTPIFSCKWEFSSTKIRIQVNEYCEGFFAKNWIFEAVKDKNNADETTLLFILTMLRSFVSNHLLGDEL